MHTAIALLKEGHKVYGIDNLNDYYPTKLKLDRITHIKQLDEENSFNFENIDIANNQAITQLFRQQQFDIVIHLAAQAGVRYSIANPSAYAQSNLVGFINILEACRHNQISHLVYASSSSVYGGNVKMPFQESDCVDHPVSLYAATKKSNELMAHSYSHLFGLPTTGLRFFTVYGPWGRPDMAPMLFTKAILAGQPIKVFNHGNMLRDFTYISDIVAGVVHAAAKPPHQSPEIDRSNLNGGISWAPYRIFNIGSSAPVALLDFINTLESELGHKAKLEFEPMAPGDVAATYADMTQLESWTGVKPKVSLREGVQNLVRWYRCYHQLYG